MKRMWEEMREMQAYNKNKEKIERRRDAEFEQMQRGLKAREEELKQQLPLFFYR